MYIIGTVVHTTTWVVLCMLLAGSILHSQGSSSCVMDMDAPCPSYPLFASAHRVELFLHPGDVLFIPALWYHCVQSQGFSVSVNVFWRNLAVGAYVPKDLYGNRDLVGSEAATKAVDEAIRALQGLPQEYQQFYGTRLVRQVQQSLGI